jgi:hypothetical protein
MKVIILVSNARIIQLSPKIPIGKGKYGFRYCNEALKFQLVEANVGVGNAMKPQNSSW